MEFIAQLTQAITSHNSLLCIGLDPEPEKISPYNFSSDDPIFEFNKTIIDATYDLVCCYKPQIACYSSLGINGIISLQKTIDYIHTVYPDLPVILDAKRGDIDTTARSYAKEVFEQLRADAVTINPYLGYDSISPFLSYKEKGLIILCKTSNPSSKDFQELISEGEPLYIHVAKKIVSWNTQNNCLLVLGATDTIALKRVRELAPDLFFLVPGIGAQGGILKDVLTTGLRTDKSGLIISSSRSIIYPDTEKYFKKQVRERALFQKNEINRYRNYELT